MSRPTDDEEVIELNMPRPRSISRKPEIRNPLKASEPQSVNPPAPRRESDAQQMQSESLAADDIALANITRDVQAQVLEDETKQEADAAGDITDTNNDDQVAPFKHDTEEATAMDTVFQRRMRAVKESDIAEIQAAIRSDPDSSIRQEMTSSQAISVARPQDYVSEEDSSPDEIPEESTSMFTGMQQHNPTYDQQYTTHQGSRGISPPPGFDDSAIPPYQDSLDAPSYQNVISQPPGLPVPPPVLSLHPNDTLPESDRPSITDKFMDAHIARHGNAALSPLALLTPDQADMLPEYYSSDLSFDDSRTIRGRGRQERPLSASLGSNEATKTNDALDTVRALEEQEAVEAIEAMEALQLIEAARFDNDQLAAMQTLGDDPSNYFSADELLQFQRLASEPGNEEREDNYVDEDNERELLEMMAQYVKRPADMSSMTTTELDAQDEIDELESMLRDRSLTANATPPERLVRNDPAQEWRPPTLSQQTFGGDLLETAFAVEPEVFAILRQANELPSTTINQGGVLENGAPFANPSSRTGVDVQAIAGAALARSVAAEEQNQESVKQPQAASQQQAGFGGGHGVKKQVMDPAAYAAQVARNEKKAEAYLGLSNQVNTLMRNGDCSSEAFDLTTKLLLQNPEYYTIWNYRREIMLQGLFPALDDTLKQELLNEELKKLQGIMKDFPKVYWIWNHRKWCLAQSPWPDWSRELLLVTKMLERDARNFHVWEYRRYVVAQIEQAEESSKAQREFEYTTAAIRSNFSNFSAWHNRTKLIPQILNQVSDPHDRDQRRQELLKDELELIKGAIYTDPDDQSVWLYHRWLINPDSADSALHPLAPVTETEHVRHLNQELEMISELLEEEPDNVWCTYAKVHYALSLQRLTKNEDDVEELRDLIASLEENDELRSGRYMDWHASTLPQVTSSPLDQNAATTSDSVKRVDGTAPEFLIFSDLKGREEWSSVTLKDESYLTAVHHAANGDETRCIILPGWEAIKTFDRTSLSGDIALIVGDTIGAGTIEYLKISRI